jgi:hypothetical protein
LKWKNGRKVIETNHLTDVDRAGIVEVKVEGDSNSVHVTNNVFHLSENPRALRATRDAFLPLGQDGFDTLKLKQRDDVIEEIDWNEVSSIVRSCNVGIDESKEVDLEPEVEVTPAWLSVYSPVYDAAAPNWRFRLGKDVIYADISETDIARQALERGASAVEDAYQVKLEITTEVDSQGKMKDQHYKVLEVIRFVPAEPSFKQPSLFDGKPK